MEALLRPLADRDDHRRTLLRVSDDLLDEVEELRLADRNQIPRPLQEAIAALQERLGRADHPTAPDTLRAAHDLVLAVQGRLMTSNPRLSAPRAHPGRAGGQPKVLQLGEGADWKLLVMPPMSAADSRDQWLELVEATVERAYQRWLYAHHKLMEAARQGRQTAPAWARARAAWRNYWELNEEGCQLRRTPGAGEPRMPRLARPSP